MHSLKHKIILELDNYLSILFNHIDLILKELLLIIVSESK